MGEIVDKRQLVETAARQSSLTKRQLNEAVDVIFATIASALTSGDSVVLRTFGRFSTWKRRQRIRDFDGHAHQVEERQPVFSASAALRRELKEKSS